MTTVKGKRRRNTDTMMVTVKKEVKVKVMENKVAKDQKEDAISIRMVPTLGLTVLSTLKVPISTESAATAKKRKIIVTAITPTTEITVGEEEETVSKSAPQPRIITIEIETIIVTTITTITKTVPFGTNFGTKMEATETITTTRATVRLTSLTQTMIIITTIMINT